MLLSFFLSFFLSFQTASIYLSIYLRLCLVGLGCRILRLNLCRGVTPPMSVLDMTPKQSDGEVRVMLKLCGMRSTPSLPSLRGPFWNGVVTPDRVPYMGQIELNCVLMQNLIV